MMFYQVHGQGKAVVLLHGFLEDGRMWQGLIPSLKHAYRLIVPDLPGFGQSPLATQTLSMDYYADEVYALLCKLQIKQCMLLGHSMGGYIALAFAAKYQPLLSGLGLLNSHCFGDNAERKVRRKQEIEQIKQQGVRSFVRSVCPKYFHPYFQKKHPQVIKKIIAQAEGYSADALIQATEAMMNRAATEEVLRQIKTPVLMINGKQDEVAPLAYTLKQASYPAIADIHFFERCKHESLLEKKTQTIRAIGNFCEQVG